MKTAGLVLLASLLSAAAAVAAVFAAGALRPAPPAPVRETAAPAPSPELLRRVAALEGRLAELAAGIESLRMESAAALEAARKEAEALRSEAEKQKERADAAASLVAAATGEAPKKPPEMDAFAKEVAKGMRQGIRQEFRRLSDLVTAPTPEALDQRRRQLKMFANAFGNNAGLDQAQIATLERILNDTDEKAREDLRPILQGVEDYRALDYVKVRKVTDDSFSAQNEQFDKEFPKDKSDRLKAQLEPVRTIFGAMIEELDKESQAFKQGQAPDK